MRTSELFIYLLLGFGWIVFLVIQRVLKRPRDLGTIQDEGPQEQPAHGDAIISTPPASPWDVEWGRGPDVLPMPVPAPNPLPRFERAAAPLTQRADDFAVSELDIAKQIGRRQAAARATSIAARSPRRPHLHRPTLRTQQQLRDAMVMAAVIGPCRAMDDWQPPDGRS